MFTPLVRLGKSHKTNNIQKSQLIHIHEEDTSRCMILTRETTNKSKKKYSTLKKSLKNKHALKGISHDQLFLHFILLIRFIHFLRKQVHGWVGTGLES